MSTHSDEIVWRDVYPELVNKIRWALATALSTPASRFPYAASQTLATVLAQDAIDVVKCSSDAPSVLSSTKTIRQFQRQEMIVSEP